MATIGSILVDGRDIDMPALRTFLATLQGSVALAAEGIVTVLTVAERDAFYATVANRGKLVYVNNNNGSATDPFNGIYEFANGGPRIATAYLEGLTTIVQPLVDQAQTAATAATAGAGGLSFPIIAEAGSTANAWKLSLPAGIGLIDKARYRFFAPSAITGDLIAEGAGANTVRYRNGVIVGPETRVQTGDQVELEWDNGPGQLFRWSGSDRDPGRLNNLERDPDPFAPIRKAINETPHGVMTKDANNNSVLTPVFLPFFSNGSSVNTPIANPNVRNGGAIPGTEPSAIVTTLFNRAFGPGVQLVNRNKSKGSTAVNEFPAQRDELIVNGDASLLASCIAGLQVPGMNDFAAGGYNTGPTFPAAGIKNYEAYLISEILAGRRIWICTSPTYHIGRAPDRERVPDGNPQYWPYIIPAPVGPSQQVPPFADSLVTLDRTGNGILTRGSRRYDHGNNLLRDMARRLNARFPGMVVLIDADHSFWVNLIEPQLTVNSTDADRVAAYDVAFTDPAFGPGAEQQSAHLGTVGQWGSYGRPLAEMVDAMRGAPGPTWWFRGDLRTPA